MSKKTQSTLISLMALRIAQHALAMGLDDEDESLLWMYVYHMWTRHENDLVNHIHDEVRRVLLDQASNGGWSRLPSRVKAEMPDRFVRQGMLSKIGWSRRLVYDKQMMQGDPNFYVCESIEKLEEDLKVALQDGLFKMWYDLLVAWEDPETGKLVEPSSSDIIVTFDMRHIDLREILSK